MINWAKITEGIRTSIRSVGRPIAGALRRALAPSVAPARWEYCKIQSGPAAGSEILLPIPSELAEKICSNRYETYAMRLLEKLISPDDVCYDIGGHYGAFTLCMARLASRGEVHTFEPIPALAERIQKSIARSQLTHAHVHAVAMAGECGTMPMRAVSDRQGDDSMAYLQDYGGVLTPRSQIQYESFQTIQAQCITLDESSALPPNFIKMDVEGAEVAVIAGGKRMLTEFKPRMLIETHGVERAFECAQLLQPLGYRAWQIAPPTMTPQILWLHATDSAAELAISQLADPKATHLFGNREDSGT